jgi:hypothetical protein
VADELPLFAGCRTTGTDAAEADGVELRLLGTVMVSLAWR